MENERLLPLNDKHDKRRKEQEQQRLLNDERKKEKKEQEKQKKRNDKVIAEFLKNKQPNLLTTEVLKKLTDIENLNNIITEALTERKEAYQNKAINTKKFENKILNVDNVIEIASATFNKKNSEGLLLLLSSLLEYKGYQKKILEGLKAHIGIKDKMEFESAIKQILKNRFPQNDKAIWENMGSLRYIVQTLLLSYDADKKKLARIICLGFNFEVDLLNKSSAINEAVLPNGQRIGVGESLFKMGLF